MSYYILGITQKKYRDRIHRQTAVCAAVFLSAIIFNLILCVLRTDATHMAFLIANIAVDSVVFSIIYFVACTQILPAVKLYKLAVSEKDGVKISGIINEISCTSETVYGLECLEMILEEECTRKVYVIREGASFFQPQCAVTVTAVDNIVVRAEVQD